jgi:hypothetical protein
MAASARSMSRVTHKQTMEGASSKAQRNHGRPNERDLLDRRLVVLVLLVGLRECPVRLRRCGGLLKRPLRRGNMAERSGQGINYRKSPSRAYAEHYQSGYPTTEAKQAYNARLAGA